LISQREILHGCHANLHGAASGVFAWLDPAACAWRMADPRPDSEPAHFCMAAMQNLAYSFRYQNAIYGALKRG
jgi:hypothetical protein